MNPLLSKNSKDYLRLLYKDLYSVFSYKGYNNMIQNDAGAHQ